MVAKQLPTWIVVLDGAQARFFALRQGVDGQIFEETAEALSASPRKASKPGRSFSTGKARGVVGKSIIDSLLRKIGIYDV